MLAVLLTICLPGVAKEREEKSPQAKVPQLAQRIAVSAPPSEADAKISALIAEVLESEAKLEVDIHRSKLVRTKLPVTRFSITEPKTLDVVQFSPTELELVGMEPGQTTLTLWFEDNQALRYLVRVKPDTHLAEQAAAEYRQLQKKINEMFPGSMVQLIPFADKLIIRGQARDSAEAAQILSVLSERGGRRGDVHRGNRAATANLIDLGPAATPTPGAGDLPARNIINLLSVSGEQQVMLKVRIAEFSRTALQQMTAQLRLNNGDPISSVGPGGISTVFSSVLNPEDLRLALTVVSANGHTKILAEPNLVTLNGQPASFLAGGEFPVPTAVGIGGVSGINTQFRTFGTELTFTPTIIDKDRIRLSVVPSFSTLNPQIAVEGIPGLNSRSVKTTVDLRVGQWLAIAGLLQDEQQITELRMPLIGHIPLVGPLFNHTRVRRKETELIVLVSPELVHPTDARETPLVLPGMEIAEPGDVCAVKHDCVPRCALQPCNAEAYPQAMRETMSRPEYQRSEKYYVYGQHGTSQ